MDKRQVPLTELLRPQQFSDLLLPERDIERLQRMKDSSDIMNMIFYGPPGMGKTSAARILLPKDGPIHAFRWNGSMDNRIDDIRNRVKGITSTGLTVFGQEKVIFIDEAEILATYFADMRSV